MIKLVYQNINTHDQKLIDAATEVLQRNYQQSRHTVGAAIECESGKIYVGINIESCGYGPCAEPIALGAALSNGERKFKKIVAVGTEQVMVISPCGNCRQLILEYAPDIEVILRCNGDVVKMSIAHLLPCPYQNLGKD